MAINTKDVGNAGGWEPNFKPNCEDGAVNGTISSRFDYILKSVTSDYPDEACTPYLHGNAQIDNLQVNQNITTVQNINGQGTCTFPSFQGQINIQSWKGFDIKHPTKENHRLRHICLEGPEAGVYFRGRLKGSTINIPEYWNGLVDPDSITVSLTQIGTSQDLIISKVSWPETIEVISGNNSNIDCYYTIQGSRIDGEELVIKK